MRHEDLIALTDTLHLIGLGVAGLSAIAGYQHPSPLWLLATCAGLVLALATHVPGRHGPDGED